MPETLSPWGWRIPDSLGNDFFKTGFTAIRNLAADIGASLTTLTTEEVPTFPTLASGWGIGSDGARITKVGRVVNLSCHLTRSGSTYASNGAIFTLPAGFIPRQMQWPPVRRFDATFHEGKINPTHTVAGAAHPSVGIVSAGVDVPAGSGLVFSTTFVAHV